MNLSDFDYPLPKELIAQFPLAQRDASRLLVADRKTGSLTDKRFRDLAELVPPGDILVLNDTKVFPAGLLGRKKETGGKVGILLLSSTPQKNIWKCLVQPALKEGQCVVFDRAGVEAVFAGRDAAGISLMEFKGSEDIRSFAESSGRMPLPPYIKRVPGETDKEAYQTVYAKRGGAGAAPTAGLPFWYELLNKIREKGIQVLRMTLHVGYGTFKPVEDIENHRMHSETFELTEEVADKINEARLGHRGIWAVGTTTLRVLETCVQNKKLIPGKGETDLFIKEPFEFEAVDHLITNFHLPKTTLLLLVSAFMGERLRKKAYEHAIAQRYRFYSYGDAMVII